MVISNLLLFILLLDLELWLLCDIINPIKKDGDSAHDYIMYVFAL